MPIRGILMAIVAVALLAAAPAARAQIGLQPGAKPGTPFGPQGSQPATPRPAAPTEVKPRAVESSRKIVLIDRIVAVVNKEVITQRDLDERVALVTQQLRQQRTQPPAREVLERQVLERMITDRAQIQFAVESGVRVDDLTLDRAIARIAEQNKLTLADFRRALEREGIEYDRFRDDIRNEILISRLREREVDSKIQISESEVDTFLESQQGGGEKAVEYNISHVFVRVPEQATPEQVAERQRRAEAALAQARSGADFAQVAVSFSDAPDALQGGNMGWRERDRMPEIFASALEKLQPGDISPVLRSPGGFHILKVNDRRGGGGALVVQQTRARHILVKTNEVVSETDARRKLDVLRERIRQGASFSDLARLNSDDPSAARGGDLGWLMPGDTVPDFERAMDQLKIGELSEPVRSPFGFHLIEVTDRRTADISADRKRLEARKVLRDRKIDEAYQEWIRQLRDRTYVEYRLEER